jgi:hypothetical protein
VLAAKSATCVLLWLGAAVVTPPEDRARLQAGFARVMTRTVAKATQEPLA